MREERAFLEREVNLARIYRAIEAYRRTWDEAALEAALRSEQRRVCFLAFMRACALAEAGQRFDILGFLERRRRARAEAEERPGRRAGASAGAAGAGEPPH